MNKKTVFLALIFSSLFNFSCSSSSSSSSNTNPPQNVVGSWIGKADIESLSYLMNPDGTCKVVNVSSQDDLGKFYLEAFKIQPNGSILDLSAVSTNSSANGDFTDKGKIMSDGRVVINQNLLTEMSKQGIQYKSYEHFVSEKNNILTYTIRHQEVIYEGQVYTMDNNTNAFVRVTDTEFTKYITQAKSCAKSTKIK